jgi:hypothetical protein
MNKKELTFKQSVAKIKANLKRRDVPIICEAAGFYSTTPFYNACKKKDWTELNAEQKCVINEALKLIALRDEEHKELRERMGLL